MFEGGNTSVDLTTCKLCKGRIYQGHPVMAHEDGLIHRFSTDCDWFRQKQKEYDEKFLKDVEIDNTTREINQ